MKSTHCSSPCEIFKKWILFRHHHHHHISVTELGHLLTHSGLTYPEVSSKVYHDSFRQLGSSISLHWVIYFEAFYLHDVSSFSCIPIICPKLVFLTPLQFVHLFYNLSKSILLFFSCISSLEEMPSLNMPVQRLKVAILPLDLPCSGPVTHSGEILTTGKSHGKKPGRFSLNYNMEEKKVSRYKYATWNITGLGEKEEEFRLM